MTSLHLWQTGLLEYFTHSPFSLGSFKAITTGLQFFWSIPCPGCWLFKTSSLWKAAEASVIYMVILSLCFFFLSSVLESDLNSFDSKDLLNHLVTLSILVLMLTFTIFYSKNLLEAPFINIWLVSGTIKCCWLMLKTSNKTNFLFLSRNSNPLFYLYFPSSLLSSPLLFTSEWTCAQVQSPHK